MLHPTMLDDVGPTCWLHLNLLKIFVQHCATLLAQQCCTMLASFEQAFKMSQCIISGGQLETNRCLLEGIILYTQSVFIINHDGVVLDTPRWSGGGEGGISVIVTGQQITCLNSIHFPPNTKLRHIMKIILVKSENFPECFM